jgi:hypothetical protein
MAADALSRPPVSALNSPSSSFAVFADLSEIAVRQLACPSTLQAGGSPSLQVRTFEVEGVSPLCDISTGRLRPLIPKEDHYLVFKAIHSMAHPGIHAIWRLISSRCLWPGIRTDIAAYCRDCISCQHAKVTKQPRACLPPSPSHSGCAATCIFFSLYVFGEPAVNYS